MAVTFFKVTMLLLLVTGAVQVKAQSRWKKELQQWKDSIEVVHSTFTPRWNG